jgi:hypothetical protein
MVAPMFDPRCSFLRTPGEKLPLDASFNFDTGTTAMHYWPPRRGVDRPPSNLTLFILGEGGCGPI